MRYSTAIHTRDEAWVWIQDPKKITDFKGVFLVKEFRGISSTAGDLFEIKTNLKPFFWGGWESNHFGKSFPWFQTQLSKPPGSRSLWTRILRRTANFSPLALGTERVMAWHSEYLKMKPEIPLFPTKKKYVMWQRTTEKESWMKMSISPIKNGDILASHVHFSGWYHWNAAVWNPSIRDLAGRCSDAISWWRILAQSELKLRGDPSEMPWKNINVSHWYLLEISQSQYAYS